MNPKFNSEEAKTELQVDQVRCISFDWFLLINLRDPISSLCWWGGKSICLMFGFNFTGVFSFRQQKQEEISIHLNPPNLCNSVCIWHLGNTYIQKIHIF